MLSSLGVDVFLDDNSEKGLLMYLKICFPLSPFPTSFSCILLDILSGRCGTRSKGKTRMRYMWSTYSRTQANSWRLVQLHTIFLTLVKFIQHLLKPLVVNMRTLDCWFVFVLLLSLSVSVCLALICAGYSSWSIRSQIWCKCKMTFLTLWQSVSFTHRWQQTDWVQWWFTQLLQ